MGFYIRKSLGFGPLRLNLSRSGLGASFGVTGARIGVGPRGSYIHMGRDGLYYRQSLGSNYRQSPGPGPALQQGQSQPPLLFQSANLQEIRSADATLIADSSAGQLLQELNRVKRRFELFPVVLVAAFAVIATLW